MFDRYFVRCIALLTSGISMVFTSVFALYLSSATGELNVFIQGLVVAAGACLDITKYVCWSAKHRRAWFVVFAVWLSILSCIASVACFITQENRNIQRDREKTSAYAAHMSKIQRLERLLANKDALVKTLMSSQYHDQWEKADGVLQDIRELNQTLYQTKAATDDVGSNQAIQHNPRSAFFESIAQQLKIPYQEAVLFAYIAFSLSIELAPICLLILLSDQRRGIKVKTSTTNPLIPSDPNAAIKDSILSGETPPIIRQVIKKHGKSYALIRTLFDELLADGLLKKSGNRFVVVQARRA